jgi:hypothetical protein
MLPRAVPWCSLGLLVWALGCGGSPGESALPPSHAHTATTVRDGERPPLTVVRRDGDPNPAFAVAITHDAGPAYNGRLARALSDALTRSKLAPRTALFTRGLVVSSVVTVQSAHILSDLQPVMLAAAELAVKEPLTPANANGHDPCDPLPRFSNEPPELGRQNVSLALVGSETQTEALAQRLRASDEWPSGDVPSSALPAKDIYTTAQSATSELFVSLVTEAAPRLLGARNALLDRGLLRDVAKSFPPNFRLKDIHVGLGPNAGCLSVSFDTLGVLQTGDAAKLIVATEELVASEVARAPESPRLLPAVLSSTAQSAAEQAAWQGLGGPAPKDDPGRALVAVMRSPEVSKSGPLIDAALTDAVRQVRSKRSISIEARVERGQGRVWASLESACPVAHETRDSAGFAGLALENAARAQSQPDLLEPYFGFGGPGLVAHVPVLGDAEPEVVADAFAAGLLRSLDSGTEVNAIARERREELVSSELVDFAANLVTHGRPSRLLSAGTHDSLSRVNPGAVRGALLDFLNTPLSLTVIGNRDEEQGRRIGRRLERLLSPFVSPGAACPEWSEPPVSGSYVLVTTSGGPSVVLAYPLPLQQLPAARAVAFLLARKDGFLDQALVAPGLTVRATAAATGTRGGSAALLVALETEPDALENASAQVRALMARVSGGAILEQHQRIAAGHFAPRPPTTPLARLFDDSTLDGVPNLDVLRRFAHSYLTDEKLVLVQARREQ